MCKEVQRTRKNEVLSSHFVECSHLRQSRQLVSTLKYHLKCRPHPPVTPKLDK